jgi:hypothetical protein
VVKKYSFKQGAGNSKVAGALFLMATGTFARVGAELFLIA